MELCIFSFHFNTEGGKKLKIISIVYFLLVGLFCQAQVVLTRNTLLMGSRWEVTLVAKDSFTANRYIDSVFAEVSRIEYLISDWKPQTQVSQINLNAGIKPVKVDKEVLDLTRRAVEISTITNGAFDISFAAMEKIWKFDGSMEELPSPESVAKARALVNFRNIIIDTIASTVFLKEKGMKIGFGALGEGYAADRCRDRMQSVGVEAGIINGSGDLASWGKQPNGEPWNIGITNPFQRRQLYGVIPLHKGSVTTSGSYEKFAEIKGKRYAHIINPSTGYPATGLISVTVFGPSTEMCNALSTSMMVMGKKAGTTLIKKYKEYSYLLVTDNGKFYATKGIRKQLKKVKRQ